MTPNEIPAAVRYADASDAAWIREQELLPESRNRVGSFEVAEHERYMAHADYVYLILEDGGERMAFGILRGFTSRANSIELLRIVAAKPGQSYGSRLLRYIMHLVFKEKGCRRLWLQVVHQNQRAINIYERLGFVREGYLRQQYMTTDGLICDLVVFGMLDQEFEGATTINSEDR